MHQGHGDDIYNYPHIRLNFSSNVYNHFCHDGLFAHLSRHLSCVANYPEPSALTVERRLADAVGVRPDCVMATSGATEAIYLIAQLFRASTSCIVAPTFAEYADACRMHGHRVRLVTAPDQLPADARLCWLCNPNNPTGAVVPKEHLLSIITSRPDTLFVLDASYAPFSSQPLIAPAEGVRCRNLLMLRSITKRFSVPGLRVGYVVGEPTLLHRLRQLQMPWSVNSLAQEATSYLLGHEADYQIPVDVLVAERERVAAWLERTGRVEVSPSDTHILLCRRLQGTAAQLKNELATQHGILIRDASNFELLTPAHFRIAVQTREENDELLKALNSTL